MPKPYRPVACGFHSELELLAMRRAEVILLHQGSRRVQGRILDMRIESGAEVLILRTGAGTETLRLDEIGLLDSE
jgi:transcriptional antiterminator Rof (Rho-off)